VLERRDDHLPPMAMMGALPLLLLLLPALAHAGQPPAKPNILMLAVDDLRPLFGKAFGYPEVRRLARHGLRAAARQRFVPPQNSLVLRASASADSESDSVLPTHRHVPLCPQVQTPFFDKNFLEQGLVFRNSYVQVAVCGPSRSSILTGRRPDSSHINAALNSWCWCQRGEFMTLPHYFKSNGYLTLGGGKIFHPDACGGPSMGQGSNTHSWCNYTHTQGDDAPAWTSDSKYG
jgi:arylsulfatase A-like enzyme